MAPLHFILIFFFVKCAYDGHFFSCGVSIDNGGCKCKPYGALSFGVANIGQGMVVR